MDDKTARIFEGLKPLRPVPGVDYGAKLADEICRLRLEEPVALQGLVDDALGQAAWTLYIMVLRKASEILPQGVSIDDVSDGQTIRALMDAIQATPLREPLEAYARKLTNGGK